MSRRGAFWGRKKKRSSSREKSATVTTGARTREALESYDYGLYYDSVNARGKCDDLVLLENLSNEEIVEVSYAACVTHRVCCPTRRTGRHRSQSSRSSLHPFPQENFVYTYFKRHFMPERRFLLGF